MTKSSPEDGHKVLPAGSALSDYRGALRRYFFRRVQNHEEAEDLTQELLLRLMKNGQLSLARHPEALIFASAANLLKDRARRARTATIFHEEYQSFRAESFEVLSPERVLQSRQSLSEALKVLNSLEPRVRDVFVLHRLEGLKYAEIADLYGISVSSVEKYIIKALALLARHAVRIQE